jgi:DNA-binding transcriptional ArsR family regulator
MRPAKIKSLTTTAGETIAVLSERHPGRSYGMQFHTTFTQEATKIAKLATGAATLRLFIVLPDHLSYTAYRRLDQTKIGAELDMNHSTVSRALKELTELGVVERRGSGPVVEWKLSPDYGWRGHVDAFHVEQRKRGKRSPAGPGGSEELPHNIYYGNSICVKTLRKPRSMSMRWSDGSGTESWIQTEAWLCLARGPIRPDDRLPRCGFRPGQSRRLRNMTGDKTL